MDLVETQGGSARIAFSTVCLPELSWRENFAAAGAEGYSAVELLMIPGWVHLTPGEVPASEVVTEARRHGLELAALHAGGLDGTSDTALTQTQDYINSVIRYAQEAHVGLVNINAMPTPPGTPPKERIQMVERLARALTQWAPALAAQGVRLTLENHYTYQIERLEDYQTIFAHTGDSPWIGATVDTGHFTSSGEDMPALIRALGPRIFHVHLKDHIGTQSVALGRGRTDNRAVLTALRAAGFRGWISVEMEVHDRENARRYVREARPYVQALSGENAHGNG